MRLQQLTVTQQVTRRGQPEDIAGACVLGQGVSTGEIPVCTTSAAASAVVALAALLLVEALAAG